MPQLVYLAFGAQIYQIEAFFSIVSALEKSRSAEPLGFGIQVFTDAPAFYAVLPVVTRSISPAWYGPHGYHFRLKHAAVREVLQDASSAVFIDTDTFFKTSPLDLFARVAPGVLLCNEIGPPLREHAEVSLLRRVEQEHGVRLDACSTNSGVIGLVQADRALLDDSMGLMDALYPAFPGVYTLEEMCLAMAASKGFALHECPENIHHYWSRKKHFRAKITAWYQKHGADPLSAAACRDVDQVSDKLPKPEQPVRAWQKTLTMLCGPGQRQFFREVLYGCHIYRNEFDNACAFVRWEKPLKMSSGV